MHSEPANDFLFAPRRSPLTIRIGEDTKRRLCVEGMRQSQEKRVRVTITDVVQQCLELGLASLELERDGGNAHMPVLRVTAPLSSLGEIQTDANL